MCPVGGQRRWYIGWRSGQTLFPQEGTDLKAIGGGLPLEHCSPIDGAYVIVLLVLVELYRCATVYSWSSAMDVWTVSVCVLVLQINLLVPSCKDLNKLD